MKFCWNTLMVTDLERSAEFYTNVLGFEITRKFSPAKNIEIIFLKAGDVSIELVCNKNLKVEDRGKGITMGFKVDSLDEAMALMKGNGIEIARGPIQVSPVTRFFFIKDPDGFEIQIVEEKAE